MSDIVKPAVENDVELDVSMDRPLSEKHKIIDRIIHEYVRKPHSQKKTSELLMALDSEYAVKEILLAIRQQQQVPNELGFRAEWDLMSLLGQLGTGKEAQKVIGILNETDQNLADRFCDFFGLLVASVDNEINELLKIHGDLFHNRMVDQTQVRENILRRVRGVLLDSASRLSSVQTHAERQCIVDEVMKDTRKEVESQRSVLKELQKIAQQLNVRYHDVLGDVLSEEWENEFADFEKNIDKIYDPVFAERLNQEKAKYERYDSQRLRELITSYEREYILTDEEYQLWVTAENGKKEVVDAVIISNKKEFEPIVKKLKGALRFQEQFEKQFERLMYGQESAQLPKDFLVDIELQALHVKPEVEATPERPLYFPVGISKDLESWEQVLRGEKKMAKPIDIYGYLFWLQNQAQPVTLVVCDEIQLRNAEAHGGLSGRAADVVRQIGIQEKKFYEHAVRAFGLSYITVVDYETMTSTPQSEQSITPERGFHIYIRLCNRLARHPLWQKAFIAMVPESVAAGDKEKLLGYAIEELAFILNTRRTKIGHPNEARYDAIAAVIGEIEQRLDQRGVDIVEAYSDSTPSDILREVHNDVIRGLYEYVNKTKSQITKDAQERPPFAYMNSAAKQIQAIQKIPLERGATGEVSKSAGKKKYEFPFVCAPIDSQNFGWRSRGPRSEESVMKFKEPYSTYFYTDNAELFLDANQVVASPDGSIGGKIMTLETTMQTQYAERVLKPMLVQFFAVIDRAPATYFAHIDKTRDELLELCKKSQTLIDLLRFVQTYIVAPAVQN